jgi:hypothetical protein
LTVSRIAQSVRANAVWRKFVVMLWTEMRLDGGASYYQRS